MVRAKFAVRSITLFEHPLGAASVVMSPVWENGKDGVNGCSENHIFSKSTPSGELKMQLNNPEAAKQFEVGKSYYVDFTLAP